MTQDLNPQNKSVKVKEECRAMPLLYEYDFKLGTWVALYVILEIRISLESEGV